ncbi:MAG: membrane protein insertase YidC [Treponema sp.]
MKKNAVLAVVLSTLVIFASMFIQHKFFPPEDNVEEKVEKKIEEAKAIDIQTTDFSVADNNFVPTVNNSIRESKYTVETSLVRVVFTNKGGDILSYRLKDYNETSGENGVEMIKNLLPDNRAFSLALNKSVAPAFDGIFDVRQRDTKNGKAIAFICNIKNKKSQTNEADFRIIKEYEFLNNDYMFSLTITLETLSSAEKQNIESVFYSLRTPPQIGPEWISGDRYEYRKFSSFSNDSMKTVKIKDGEQKMQPEVAQWVAVSGKYFALAVLPEKPIQNTTYSLLAKDNMPLYDSQIFINTSPVAGNKRVDVYHVYIGPNSDKFLSKYNVSANNILGINDAQINMIAASGGILWPLEMLLKFLLENINKLVGNWGVSILIITLIMRLLFFPLTKKSGKATRKMQEMQPKIKEIQEKYKGSPQRLNTEMTRLYQEAGYSPLSGCLPMLIQIPFLFAMFALFNNYFEFRGSSFIPGWIPDLSSGDSVWRFGFALPVLGWTDLRILPIIYVASQLVFGKVTQAGTQDNNNPSMQIMVYFMPLFFFFIFYNAPSGLLLFWTASNILMLIQQIIINKALDKEEALKKKK